MTISHRDLWRAKWPALCRLARYLGLRVREGPEHNRRGPMVEACMRRMAEIEMDYYARGRHGKAKERRLYAVQDRYAGRPRAACGGQ